MKYRLGYEAVITIQRARIHPRNLHASNPSISSNPYVHIGIMVPKGSEDVTVPTNCVTRILPRTDDPVWNQTFRLPVMPNSDVLVLQVFNEPSPQSGIASRTIAKAQRVHLTRQSQSMSNPRPPHPSESQVSSADLSSAASVHPLSGKNQQGKIPDGVLIGLCLLPVARIAPNGEVTKHAMEIFPRPTEPTVGCLYVATKMERKAIPTLTLDDLRNPAIISQFHSSRLLAAESRFLGIGELAAFLFEEGYSTSPTENWDRAVVMLAQQLAFRMYQIKSSSKSEGSSSEDSEERAQYIDSLNDEANFEKAKRRVLKEGGLWDGL